MNPLLLIALFCVALTLPTQYDLRVQPSLLKYADYSLHTEGVCASYAWAKELAQILSNAISFRENNRYSLSTQQLLQCISTQTSVCHQSTKEQILAGLNYVQKFGLTLDSCYLNRPLELPGPICQRYCHNGYKPDFHFTAKTQKYLNASSLFQQFKKTERIAAFAIVKVTDSYNYYSSENPTLSSESGILEYRVAEVVGWKNGTEVIILRMGAGQNWGYNGYAYINLKQNPTLIEEYYVFDTKINANIRAFDA